MTLDRILEKLDQQGVKLWVDGDRLRVRAPKGVLTPELQNLLRDRKAEFLAWLHQNNGSIGEGAIDLSAEAVLDSSIYPEQKAESPGSEPAAIFLTGTTGFLGAFLLWELLLQTRADIYCLVRAADRASAQMRIQQNLEFYYLWDESFRSRIIPVLGDISQPRLGLSEEHFCDLASQIDSIYHSAARLNYLYSYLQLKSTNVLGTQEVLKFACQTKAKPLHYISSVVVFEGLAYAGKTIFEADDPDSSEGIYLGYSQSKWVAERLVTIARSRGLPVNIYRLPFISGHSQTGIGNLDDLACRLIKGYIQMSTIPDLDDLVDLSPVDYASKAIAYLSRQKEVLNRSFHLNNPHPCPRKKLFDYIRSRGYPLERLPYQQWQERLANLSDSQQNALSPLLSFFSKRWSTEGLTIPEFYQQDWKPKFDCQATIEALQESSIVCPPADKKLLDTYFSYFIRSGFIEAPLNPSSQIYPD